MSTSEQRELDLVLVGATGFVGRLTAQRLATHAPAGLRIGLAGRSADRLAEVRAALPSTGTSTTAEWPLITVDVLDDGAVADLVARTRVVVSAVGPYLRYGLPLVQACARARTHYADLTGETLFVRRSIDAAHEEAVASGARIVHSCGFDSVPSDLGVGLSATHAAEAWSDRLTSAVLHVRSLRGGISGGTVDSLRQQILESEQDPTVRRLLGDPLALVDDLAGRAYGSSRGRRRLPVDQDEDSGTWQAPFVMGTYNRQIVQRSNALTDWSYGRELSYREVVDAGRGPRGAVTATAIALGTGGLVAGLSLGPTRWLMDKALPKPGEGPSEKQRAGGRFRVAVDAVTTEGRRVRTTIGADHDPGYDGTAVMLSESGLALADGADLGPAGVVTPMVALGRVLPERLRTAGFTVTTEQLD